MPVADEIVLVTGPEKERLRVSAGALRLASSVFDKMLGPNFREGRQAEIELPDDDPTGMRLVIGTIMYEKMPPSIDGDAIRSVATLADKYDVKPAWLLIETALQRCDAFDFDPADTVGYVQAALIYDEPGLFSKVSAIALWVYDPNQIEPLLSMDVSSAVLVSILESRRAQIRRSLFKSAAYRLTYGGDLPGRPASHKELFTMALHSDVHASQPLKSVVAAFADFPVSSGYPALPASLKSAHKHLGAALHLDLALSHLPCANSIGLCIDCVKRIMTPDEVGMCRRIPPLPGPSYDTLGLSPHFYRGQM